MKSFALCASLLLLATGSAGQKPAPAAPSGMEFDSVYIVFLRRPANPTQYDQAKLEDIQKRHLAHLGDLYRSGKAVTAGPFDEQDDQSNRGLIVMPASLGKEEVRRLTSDDPAVKAGRLKVEIVRWYFQKGTAVFPHPDAPMPK
ncbi:MAG: YciI family protein [Myxococcales bacterium]